MNDLKRINEQRVEIERLLLDARTDALNAAIGDPPLRIGEYLRVTEAAHHFTYGDIPFASVQRWRHRPFQVGTLAYIYDIDFEARTVRIAQKANLRGGFPVALVQQMRRVYLREGNGHV